MKTKLLLIIVFLITFSKPCLAETVPYWWSWCSIGGTDTDKSFSVGYSFTRNFAFEIGYMTNSEYSNYSYLTDSDQTYTVLTSEHNASALGIDALWFINRTDNRYKFYIGTGIYEIEKLQLVISDYDYKTYKKFKNYSTEISLSAGFQFHAANVNLGIGYHTIRGYNLQIVWILKNNYAY